MRLINLIRVLDESAYLIISQGDDTVYFGEADGVPEYYYGSIVEKIGAGDDNDLFISLQEEEEETAEDILNSFGC